MTDFTIKVRPDQGNEGTNEIELFLDTNPKREVMIPTNRGDSLDVMDEEDFRAEDEVLYYAVERIAHLERRLTEANTLLDQVYGYVDSHDLAELGESKVQAVINHCRKSEYRKDLAQQKAAKNLDRAVCAEKERDELLKYIEDLRKAHNQSDVLVHNMLKEGPR